MINAVILLNDDLHNVSDCNSYETCTSSHMAKSQSNMFFLLSVSIPKPLFPSMYQFDNYNFLMSKLDRNN